MLLLDERVDEKDDELERLRLRLVETTCFKVDATFGIFVLVFLLLASRRLNFVGDLM